MNASSQSTAQVLGILLAGLIRREDEHAEARRALERLRSHQSGVFSVPPPSPSPAPAPAPSRRFS